MQEDCTPDDLRWETIRRCAESGDVDQVRKLWGELFPDRGTVGGRAESSLKSCLLGLPHGETLPGSVLRKLSGKAGDTMRTTADLLECLAYKGTSLGIDVAPVMRLLESQVLTEAAILTAAATARQIGAAEELEVFKQKQADG